MSKKIDNLIYLIENVSSDDNFLFNPERIFPPYGRSAKGLLKAFLQPGTEVLYLPKGERISNAIRCTTAESTFDDEKFSFQPYEYTNELDSAASFREQGPVYKTRNVGPRLYGKAAREAWNDQHNNADFTLVTEDGEEINCEILSYVDLKKKSFTRNKKKYTAVYIEVYHPDDNSDGLVIFKISLANRRIPSEESSARREKIRTNKLNKIDAEIGQLELRLIKLKDEKERLEWQRRRSNDNKKNN